MNYEQKQLLRIERYKELAQKAEQKSVLSYEKSNKLSDIIPFGQPILVGHHSEKRHRRDIERIHNAMKQSIELQEKAEYYKNKAEAAESNTNINSDDPKAISKLKEKLQGLERLREKIKSREHQSYELSNLSQNIRSVKERIVTLESREKIEGIEEKIGEITLKVDKEENRVKLFFPNIPSEEIRTKLKCNGFRWSPYNQAWQRKNINEWSIHIAREIAGGN